MEALQLKAGPLKERFADWAAHYRRFWTESFDRRMTIARRSEKVKKHGHGKLHGNKSKKLVLTRVCTRHGNS